ncbi:MAG TPA: hypothetical protein VI757_00460 [Bacteroidia bacterium]|nr:hypothetical protein [Bacteroidia bacterium]
MGFGNPYGEKWSADVVIKWVKHMAEDELVGNLATENLIGFCKEKNIELSFNESALNEAILGAASIFG